MPRTRDVVFAGGGLIAIIFAVMLVASLLPTGSPAPMRVGAATPTTTPEPVVPEEPVSPFIGPTVSAKPSQSPSIAVQFHLWAPYYADSKPTDAYYAHLDALAAMNARQANTVSRVRVDVGWSSSQPERVEPDIEQWYNARLKQLCLDMFQRGLKPYFTIHQSPAWSRPDTIPNEVKRYPADPKSITPWATWLVKNFSKWVTEYEVWNEPNLEAFTGTGQATPDRYVPLLAAFRAGAKAARSSVKIIAPGVSQSDWLWIKKAYDLGLKQHCDILAVHPYQGNQAHSPNSVDVSGVDKSQPGWEMRRITAGMPKILETMAAAGDADKPIWITEQGWGADPTPAGIGSSGVPMVWPSINHKAAYFIAAQLDWWTRNMPQVRLHTVYQLFDPISNDPHQKGFEIINADGTLKPQAEALIMFRAYNGNRRALY